MGGAPSELPPLRERGMCVSVRRCGACGRVFACAGRTVCHSSENADSNTSAGRNAASMRCASMPLHRSVDSPSEPMCTLRFTAPTTKPSRSSATVYGTGVLLTAVRATAPMASAMKRKYRATWPWTAWLPWPSDAEAAGASAAMTMAQLTEQVRKSIVQAPPRSNAVCLCLVTSRSPPQGDAPAQVKGPPCEGKRKQQVVAGLMSCVKAVVGPAGTVLGDQMAIQIYEKDEPISYANLKDNEELKERLPGAAVLLQHQEWSTSSSRTTTTATQEEEEGQRQCHCTRARGLEGGTGPASGQGTETGDQHRAQEATTSACAHAHARRRLRRCKCHCHRRGSPTTSSASRP